MDIIYQNVITDFFYQNLSSKIEIVSVNPLYGGSINRVYRLDLKSKIIPQKQNSFQEKPITSNIQSVVVKVNIGRPMGFLQKELDGLKHLRQAVQDYKIEIRIPKPIATLNLDGEKPAQLLIMEYIPHSKQNYGSEVWKKFGYHLAKFHHETSLSRTGNHRDHGKTTNHKNSKDIYGWHENTFIGNSVQYNTLEKDWVVFFRKHRLIPQMEWGEKKRLLTGSVKKKLDLVINNLENTIPSHPPPSLLHGDLWTGNFFFSEDGKPVIFDPAVYYGHGESDLAMTELFGCFPPAFYSGYHSLFPQDQQTELRKTVYNLYHLVNHLNLFGTSYLASVESALNRILSY